MADLKFNIINEIEGQRRANLAGFSLLGVAILSLFLVPLLPPKARIVGLSLVSVSAIAGQKSFRNRDIHDLILDDIRRISDQNRQNFYSEALVFEPEEEIIEPEPYSFELDKPLIEEFDWAELSNRTKHPHLAIIAPTGSGKSTLATWLASKESAKLIVIDPHYEPGNYDSASVVVGKGSNLGKSAWLPDDELPAKNTPTLERSPKLAPNTSACECIAWLYEEMKKRYDKLASGNKDWEPITVIADEFPAYAQKPGVSAKNQELIAQARKVGIRLIYLVQGYQVKLFGLEGASDLRSNLTQIRLGHFAIEEAETQLNKQRKGSPLFDKWLAICDYLKQSPYPALIGNRPATVPDLSSD